jgi:hypothetical protein
MPELANTSVRRIQEVCHDDLKLPSSRRVAKKPPRRLELVRKQKKGKTKY